MSLPAYLEPLDPPGQEQPQFGYTRHRPMLLSGRDAKTGEVHRHISSLPLNCAWRCLEAHKRLIGFVTGTKCESVTAYSAASTALPNLRIVGGEEDTRLAVVLMVLLLRTREEWGEVEHPDAKKDVEVVENTQAGAAVMDLLKRSMRRETEIEKGGAVSMEIASLLMQLYWIMRKDDSVPPGWYIPPLDLQAAWPTVDALADVQDRLRGLTTPVPVSAKSAKAEASDVSSSSGLFQATLDIVPISIHPLQRGSCPFTSPGPSVRRSSSSADATVVTNSVSAAPALRRRRSVRFELPAGELDSGPAASTPIDKVQNAAMPRSAMKPTKSNKSWNKKQSRDGMALPEWEPLQPVPAPNWKSMARSGGV